MRPVFVVLDGEGRFAETLRGLGGSLVLNQEADEGIAASIRAGVRAAKGMPSVEGVVLMTCDQVGITAEHLRELQAEPEQVAGSGYAGGTAIPAYFPRSAFESLLRLQGDVGAREALRGARRVDFEVLAVDVDTPQDVIRATALFGAQRSS
jgi:molybdenum cofactor cytidylyltransferase